MAADVGVDPSEDNCPRASDADSKCRRTRAELLVYLIDERGLDVNAMDEYVPPPKNGFSHRVLLRYLTRLAVPKVRPSCDGYSAKVQIRL
ncbi:hypothetical protein ANO14919_038610 [Xylariales sp. No.14919]|nr:hypothetical protein ANO14919_038610 [Xylariales sp. No.14919]